MAFVFTNCYQNEVYHYKATAECNNLRFNVGRLFPTEVIKLYYNEELLLNYKVDSLDGFRFERHFCLDYKEIGQLRVVSDYQGKTYLDTTLTAKKEDYGYLLTVSLPHPVDWESYYDDSNSVPIKEWGYLPIENSVRLVYLRPDTVLAETWIDTVP